MPVFNFTARNSNGESVTGTVSADNERAALDMITRRELFPLSVAAEAVGGEIGPLALLRSLLGGRVSTDARCRFYRQLADMLKAGLPIMRALSTLERQSTDKGLKPILEEIRLSVAAGGELGEAMAAFPDVFNELELGMIRAGEKGGFLEDVLIRLADFTERAREVRSQVTGALVYPAILTVAGVGVVVCMMVFVIPAFATMLSSMGKLPLATRIVMGISEFLQANILYLLLGLGVGGSALANWMRTPGGQLTVDHLRLKLPILGRVTTQVCVARFARTLGTLLASGIQIGPALRIAADAVGNKVVAADILAAAERVKQGEPLAVPLSEGGRFPPMLTEMIAIGEETGSLDRVLVDAAAGYERDADRAVSMLVKLLEPLVLVTMTGIVLVIALAAILPALTAASNMGRR